MPRDGNGTMTRVHNWTDDANANIDITASRFDAENDDFRDEITNSVAADGQTPMTGNLQMGTNRVTGIGDATALTDAISAKQVQNSSINFVTAGGTANAITLTLAIAPSAYVVGQVFCFLATNTNTGATTINVNGLGAKNIYKDALYSLDSADIVSGKIYFVVYDGTQFQILGSQLSHEYEPWLTGTLWCSDNIVSRPVVLDYAIKTVTANTGTSYDINCNSGNGFNLTLTGNCTFTFSNPPASGNIGEFRLVLSQDATGGRTVTWPASVDWGNATAPILSTSANAVDILGFLTVDGGTTWYGFLGGTNYG